MAYQMNYSLEHIAETLHKARVQKGLSQRKLGDKVGIPQSHLSKIENAGIDLQTSSLIEIARALDLEVMLIPRPLITTVKGLISASLSNDKSERTEPAYGLDEE